MWLALNSEEVHWGMTLAAASWKQTYKISSVCAILSFALSAKSVHELYMI